MIFSRKRALKGSQNGSKIDGNIDPGDAEIGPENFLAELVHLGTSFDDSDSIFGYLGASRADFGASGCRF